MMRFWLAGGVCAGIVAVLQCAAAAGSLRIVPIEPIPGGHVSSEQPTIEFEIHTAGDVAVTRNQVSVALDGIDAGRSLQTAGSHLEIVPRQRLSQGSHHVDVSVTDSSGERAVDHWTFTVDAQDAAVPTVEDDSSANAGDGDDTSGDAYGAGSFSDGNAYVYGDGSPYGLYPGSGTFFPVGFGPYYYGESIPFIYNGFGGGGFVTLAGFPGVYPLVPFGPNYYFVTVPVPRSYRGGTPVGVCHVPGHRRYVLDSGPVKIETVHRPAGSQAPAWVAPRWRPTLASLTTFPGTPRTVRQSVARQLALPAGSRLTTMRPARIGGVPQVVSPSFTQARIGTSSRRILPAYRDIQMAPRFAPMTTPRFAPMAAPHFAPVPAQRTVAAPIMRR